MTYLQRCWTIYDIVLQTFTCDTDSYPAHFLAPNFNLDLSRMIDENAIVAICQVEGHRFVYLFTRRSAILVPDTY